MSDPSILLPLPADVGLPTIVLVFPAMLILLIPIIVVEGLLCKKWLGLTTWQAMKANALSNLVSTIIGIPVAWLLMFLVDFAAALLLFRTGAFDNWHSPLAKIVFVVLGSAWIGPLEGQGIWFIPAAALILLIPFFFASYWIEYRVIKFMVGKPKHGLPALDYPKVRIAVRNANLVTYGIMFLATSVWLVFSLPHH